MREPRVYNMRELNITNRNDVPAGMVYVGRPTKWGNPFVIDKDGDRDEVVELYRERLEVLIQMKAGIGRDLGQLRDKDLVCWCAPERCHADVLLEFANNL